MKNKTNPFVFYFFLTVFTAAVILVFSSTTSPLYPNSYGVDSAFNRFMGLMIRRGKTLYSGIWDNKGPVLFFLQALGTLKGTRNSDITLTFLMQICSLALTFFFLCKTGFDLFPERKNCAVMILPVICGAAVFVKVMEGGNLSEEWSLPMIACSLYLLVKYAAHVADEPLHPRRYAFVHGVCFGLIAFIRINNAVSICAGLLAVAVYLIRRKKWQNLRENIFFGLLGTAAVTLPVFLYFSAKHALGDMLYGVFFYNLKYAAERTHRPFYGTELLFRLLPVAAAFVIILIRMIRTRRLCLPDCMMLFIVLVNGVMLWSSNRFLHYYIIFVPVFLLTLILYTDFLRIPEFLVMLAVLAFFVCEDVPLLSGLPDAGNQPDQFAYAASIPEGEKDPAIVIYASPAVYLNSGLIPCSRFAAYHFAHFPVDPSMKDEFLEDLHKNQPIWIVFLSGYEGVYPEVQEMLDTGYEKMHEEYGISYYRMK